MRALTERFDLKKRYDVRTYETLRKDVPELHPRHLRQEERPDHASRSTTRIPQFAADLANAHAGEITKVLGRLAVSEAQLRRVFFEQQLKETKENLIKAEQELRTVQEKSGVIVLDKQAEALIARRRAAARADRRARGPAEGAAHRRHRPEPRRHAPELRAARAARRARPHGIGAGRRRRAARSTCRSASCPKRRSTTCARGAN